MTRSLQIGDCVRIPDGRIARVRGRIGGKIRVRVRRKTSETNQFLLFPASRLAEVPSPQGWMSPEGYRRYLRKTLAKQRSRQKSRTG
jgi:hypothetical protein